MQRLQAFTADVQQLIRRLQVLQKRTKRPVSSIGRIKELANEQEKCNSRWLDSAISESERASAHAQWNTRQKEIDRLCGSLQQLHPDIHRFSRDLENLLASIPMNRQLEKLRQEIRSLGFPQTLPPPLKDLRWEENAELMPLIVRRLEEMCEVAWEGDSKSIKPIDISARQLNHLAPLEIFCSYAHKDEKLRTKLEMHLSVLKNEGLISSWHDRLIGPGIEWNSTIDFHLNTAGIILLLVSADFLASNYCSNIELKRAMERHLDGSARVIPIIMHHCDWNNSPIGKLQALPKDGKPVASWRIRDLAFTDIVNGIRSVINDLRSAPSLINVPFAKGSKAASAKSRAASAKGEAVPRRGLEDKARIALAIIGNLKLMPRTDFVAAMKIKFPNTYSTTAKHLEDAGYIVRSAKSVSRGKKA